MSSVTAVQKAHRAPQSGVKAKKKKNKGKEVKPSTNLKGFSFKSAVNAHKQRQRNADREHKKHVVPIANRSYGIECSDPPLVIAIVGPPKSGKTTLLKGFVKHYSNHTLSGDYVNGPVTVVTGKARRITFMESVGSNLYSMLDLAKIADVVLLTVNAAIGFEMETFEFLNMLQIHGFPRVMAVLTHLDKFQNPSTMKKTKTALKHRLWSEIYQGAKVFFLSKLKYGKYLNTEIRNLTRFLSVIKLRPLKWKNAHSFLLSDRVEVLNREGSSEEDGNDVAFYGYLRGTNLKSTQKVHLIGVGDFPISSLEPLSDPCPLPQKQRQLASKEKRVYAPMADVGSLVYDADAVYVDLREKNKSESHSEAQQLVNSLKQTAQDSGDQDFQLFRDSEVLDMEASPDESGASSSKEEMSQEKLTDDASSPRNDVFDDDFTDSDTEFFTQASHQAGVKDAARAMKQRNTDWTDPTLQSSLKDLFVTGSREEPQPDENEDMEEAQLEDNPEDAKLRKKEDFDREYDEEKDTSPDLCEELRQEQSLRAKENAEAFADEDWTTRMKHEGLQPGVYARVVLSHVPVEFAQHLNPRLPVVLGALQVAEDRPHFLQMRFKKHRWHPKILKNNDPLIVSVGWRRFQTVPTYSVIDDTRNRMLKYTPEHMHCMATFYAPMCSPGSGVIAFQSVSEDQVACRVVGTGVITECDDHIKIVKKLKLTGVPYQIEKNTAFVKDMFTSSLEASKFEGAKIQTVSGIRGQIKKALKDGSVRVTFEDKILMSDIVFVRTWTQVEPKQLYNPLCNLLSPDEDIVMKTTAALRREKGLPIPLRKDSEYPSEIERPARAFNPLHLPKTLQSELPFSSKPKQGTRKKASALEERRRVPLEKQDRIEKGLLGQLTAVKRMREEKRAAGQAERDQKKAREAEKLEEKLAPIRKANRKAQFQKRH